MTLKKRGNYWHIDISFKGRRIRKSADTTNKNNALLLHNKILQDLWNEEYLGIIKDKSFAELAEFYTLNNKTIHNLSKSRISHIKKAITDGLTLPFFKNQYNSETMFKYIDYLQTKYADRTIAKYVEIFNSINNFCKARGFIKENFMEAMELTYIKKSKKEHRKFFLSQEQLEVIKEYCKATNQIDLLEHIEFAIYTGLRKGEQLGLEWNRVYFDKKVIYINETKTDVPRHVPLLKKPLEILNSRKEQEKPFLLTKGKLQTRWTKLKEDLNITGINWHDLRHTFATWAINGEIEELKNFNIGDIGAMLGHSTEEMTKKYAHRNYKSLINKIKE